MQTEELKQKIIKNLSTVERKGMSDLIQYLEKKTDYFIAPASTKFHGNYKNGLAEHSQNVVDLLTEKNDKYSLGLSKDSIFITGYLHDLCKCNTYKEAIKLRKNKQDKWEGYKTYETVDELPLGHGEKSIIIIQQFVRLTVEESLMIRWHMGAHTPQEDRKYFEQAYKKYKSVLAIYTADEEAANILEPTVEPEVCTIEEYNAFIKNKL